jgi:DNA modification methylase
MASNSDWLIPAFNEMYRVLENNRYAVVFYGWNDSGLASHRVQAEVAVRNNTNFKH